MELTIIDQLLICLVDRPRDVPMAMREAGHDQEDFRGLVRSQAGRLHRIDRPRHGSSDPGRSGSGRFAAAPVGSRLARGPPTCPDHGIS